MTSELNLLSNIVDCLVILNDADPGQTEMHFARPEKSIAQQHWTSINLHWAC